MTTQVGLVSDKLLVASPAFPWLFPDRKSVANEVTEILLAGSSTVIIFRQWSGQFAGYCLIPIVLFVEPLPQLVKDILRKSDCRVMPGCGLQTDDCSVWTNLWFFEKASDLAL